VLALLPPGVVTDISTVLTAPAGTVVDICVELSTLNDATAVVPKLTVETALKLAPVITIGVPPLIGPLLVEIALIVGIAYVVKRLAALAVLAPPLVVTKILKLPAPKLGSTAVIRVSLLTVKLVAGVVPNRTEEAPVK
jgi:hypothetical protein